MKATKTPQPDTPPKKQPHDDRKVHHELERASEKQSKKGPTPAERERG